MNPERERKIDSTAAYAAEYIAIAPEPSDRDQYTFGSCNLGPAFCSISPTVEELLELKARINQKLGKKIRTEIGDFGKAKPHRYVAHIKPHEGDFLALFISLN